jgi:hypothetical protein
MTDTIDLICRNCKHFRPIAGGCDAFPDDGIPDEILLSNEHSKPIKGQRNKIVFEHGQPAELSELQIP